MFIGMSYDLRDEYLAAGLGEEETAEFDRESTIAGVEEALRSLGHRVERIGSGRAVAQALVAGKRWDLVFNIAEGLYGNAREAQVPAILDLYEVPYTFSDPLVLAITLNKAITNRLLASMGVYTPTFAVVSRPEEAEGIGLPFPLFVKPVAEGTGKGVTPASVVHSPEELRRQTEQVCRQFKQPALVEEFLPGREFTVGILGSGEAGRVLGVMEINLRGNADRAVYSYRNKEECESLVTYSLADDPLAHEAGELALRAWRLLGCRDAGRVDIRENAAGRATFMEVNPLAGIHKEHSDLPIICNLQGIPYGELIGAIVDSAARRVGAAPGVTQIVQTSGIKPERMESARR